MTVNPFFILGLKFSNYNLYILVREGFSYHIDIVISTLLLIRILFDSLFYQYHYVVKY